MALDNNMLEADRSTVEFDSLEKVGECYVGHKDNDTFFLSFNKLNKIAIDSCCKLDKISVRNNKIHYEKNSIYNKDKEYQYPNIGLYIVVRHGLLGIVDKECNVIVPIKYDELGLISEEIILAREGKKMRLFSIDGQEHTHAYDKIEILPSYEARYSFPTFYVTNKMKRGFIGYQNSSFNIIYPCVFDELIIGRKHALFEDRYIIDGIRIRDEILDPAGNYIKKPASSLFEDGILWMTDYSYIGLAIAVKQGGKFGLIGAKLSETIPYAYNNILKIDAFHYLLSKDGRTTLVAFNRQHVEKLISTYNFNTIKRLSASLFVVERNNKYGVVHYNSEHDILEDFINIKYDSIKKIYEYFIIVELSDVFGCFDFNGERILDVQYDSIIPFNEIPSPQKHNKILNNKFYNNDILFASTDKSGLYYNERKAGILYSYKNRAMIDISFEWIQAMNISHYGNPNSYNYLEYGIQDKRGIITMSGFKNYGLFDKVEEDHSYLGFFVFNHLKFGYIDIQSLDVIPCNYDSKVSFVEHTHRFLKIIDSTTGEEHYFDTLLKQEISNSNGLSKIEANDDGTWKLYFAKIINHSYGSHMETFVGIYNSMMENIIPPIYKSISKGINQQYIVSDVYGYGIIDDKGDIICSTSSEFISVCKINGIECYERGNESISFDGTIFYKRVGTHYYSSENDNGSKNIVTSFGSEYYFVEDTFTHDNITILRISGKYIAINEEKELTAEPHDKILINKNNKYIVLIDDNKRVFIDYFGNKLGKIEGSFTSCILQHDAGVICAVSRDTNGKKIFKLYSTSGEELNKTDFDFIGTFSENFATCVINSKKPIDNVLFKSVQNEYFFHFNKDEEWSYGQWGLINNRGEIIIPPKFDFIKPVKNGMTVFVKDGKYGVISPLTRKSTVPKYKNLLYFTDGLCRYRKFTEEDIRMYRMYTSSKCGFIDINGREVIPAAYSSAEPFRNGQAIVYNHNFKNKIDTEGNLLCEWEAIPSIYDGYDNYDDGYSQSELDDMYRGAFENDPEAQWNID